MWSSADRPNTSKYTDIWKKTCRTKFNLGMRWERWKSRHWIFFSWLFLDPSCSFRRLCHLFHLWHVGQLSEIWRQRWRPRPSLNMWCLWNFGTSDLHFIGSQWSTNLNVPKWISQYLPVLDLTCGPLWPIVAHCVPLWYPTFWAIGHSHILRKSSDWALRPADAAADASTAMGETDSFFRSTTGNFRDTVSGFRDTGWKLQIEHDGARFSSKRL